MRHVGMLEAKTHLSALVADVEGGGTVVLTRNGRAVARIVGMDAEPPKRRIAGAELAERFRLLRDQIAAEDPGGPDMTWDELKALARK